MAATSSPSVVPAPYSDAGAVDPEEAFERSQVTFQRFELGSPVPQRALDDAIDAGGDRYIDRPLGV